MTKRGPDDEFIGELRRLMWQAAQISQRTKAAAALAKSTSKLGTAAKSKIERALSAPLRSGEPQGADRKRIMRQIRRMLEKGTKAVGGKATTEAAHHDGLRFIEVLFANAERARQDPDFLKGIPPHRRYEYMAKPWKGHAGRKAKSKRSDDKRQLALDLDRQGLTQREIAERIGLSERTVRTYLNRKF